MLHLLSVRMPIRLRNTYLKIHTSKLQESFRTAYMFTLFHNTTAIW